MTIPSRKTTKAALEAAARMPTIPKEIIDQFVTGPMTAVAVNDLSMAFRKALIERALNAELSHHLGYPPGADKPREADNHRNGSTSKTVLTGHGPMRIDTPRDRDGLLIQDSEQPLAQLGLNLEPADTLDQLNAASIRYRIAVGQGAGGRSLTFKNPALTRTDSTPKPFTANQDGFSLNCAVACQPHQRDRLERRCRYIARPALCLDRLSVNTTGQVVYQLKNPFRDGTTHVLFSPADFIARLAALVPRPRADLTRYHGVFAPSSPFRQHVVPAADKPRRHKTRTTTDERPPEKNIQNHTTTAMTESPTAPLSWAQRLKRVFNIDITLCPLCGGQLRIIEDVTDPNPIRKILDHVQQRAPPRRPPARALTHRTLPDLFVER